MFGRRRIQPKAWGASGLEIVNERNKAMRAYRCSRHRVVLGFRNARPRRGMLNLRGSDPMAAAVCGRTARAASGRGLVCAKSGVF
jgi:hypothetical protein